MHPGYTGASIKTRTSNGSPTSARVEGTKPKSKGKTAPAGSTPLSTKVSQRGSNMSLFGEPLGVSMTTIRQSSSKGAIRSSDFGCARRLGDFRGIL